MIPLRDNNPTTSRPYVTWILIAINVLAFLLETSMGRAAMHGFVFQFGLLPIRVTTLVHAGYAAVSPAVALPFFTSMFLHGGWLHLGGNMLYLYVFGDNVEDVLGHVRFLVFYLACGLGAALGHFLVYPVSDVPVVGASGAIAGVLGAYALLFPRARVVTLVFLFIFVRVMELPALFLLGIWFLLQFASGVASLGPERMAGGGVAWWAHIGGFLLGMLLVSVLPKRKTPRVLYL